MKSNNTGYNWEITGGKPQNTERQRDRVLSARSPNGRVQVEIDQQIGQVWSNGEMEHGTYYTVNVYESTNYDYFPKHNDGEFVDFTLAASVRPSNSGHGHARTYNTARQLLMNAVIAIETENKWLSEPLDTPNTNFITPKINEEEARKQTRELVEGTPPGTNMTQNDLIGFARENEKYDLAEYVMMLDDVSYEIFMGEVRNSKVEP